MVEVYEPFGTLSLRFKRSGTKLGKTSLSTDAFKGPHLFIYFNHSASRYRIAIMKFGFKESTLHKWKAILELKEYFDKKIDSDVYLLFEKE